ncbi:MAG: ornithine--oxo-acid transaminase, partial [Gammaproteobacteria bacterium]|nr:ornithine--oxo-acid transaminase [Gammaproteobacteria bacterium]
GAHNYHPLPAVLVRGEGAHLWDENGKKYLDMMSAYSAVSLGHCHPELVETLKQQAEELCIVSRAYHTDKLGYFLEKACKTAGYEAALPMNTGVEAVETALKAARKWAYTVKGVPENQAEIIVCSGNFHGRTITVVSFSTEAQYKSGFGPLTPGFKTVTYGDIDALEKAITKNTAAFLLEPIQGEGGIVIPPDGYLKACADICKKHNLLLLCDEIQTGLGRTGKLFAFQHEGIHPDGLILGKALGGGILPVSMFLSSREVMDVFTPGDHGSTFGGNPLSCAVATKALEVIVRDDLAGRSAELGKYFLEQLRQIKTDKVKTIRGRGLFIGIEVDPTKAVARKICLALMDLGILSKETHETVIRLAPPLVITKEEIDWAVEQIRKVLS